ncbi:protein of unknown function [Caballeronia sp. S22]
MRARSACRKPRERSIGNTQDKHGRPLRRPSIYLQAGRATSRPGRTDIIRSLSLWPQPCTTKS